MGLCWYSRYSLWMRDLRADPAAPAEMLIRCAVVYAFAVCKRLETHDIMQHFQHIIQEIFNYLRFFGVYVFACTRVRELVCLGLCYLCCVYLCGWEKYYMIRAALGTSHLKREILFLTCNMWRIVIIVIWTLFRKMPVNQKPLNRIGIFWYQFTPRKLLYLLVSLNFVKFGPHWLSVLFWPPCIGLHFKTKLR